jgi:hypothetical protein
VVSIYCGTQIKQAIFPLHDDMRYAAVLDDVYRLIAGAMRKDFDSLVEHTDVELYLSQRALKIHETEI